MKNYIFILIIPFLLLFSCKKSESEKELELLQAYINENNITTEPTASGLYYIETLEGTGGSPEPGDLIQVHYEGHLLSNGEVFDSSLDGDPGVFTLGNVIPGWNEGISYMKRGGKATLIIPSSIGYGSSGSGSIPGYSTLIFEVELIAFLTQ